MSRSERRSSSSQTLYWHDSDTGLGRSQSHWAPCPMPRARAPPNDSQVVYYSWRAGTPSEQGGHRRSRSSINPVSRLSVMWTDMRSKSSDRSTRSQRPERPCSMSSLPTLTVQTNHSLESTYASEPIRPNISPLFPDYRDHPLESTLVSEHIRPDISPLVPDYLEHSLGSTSVPERIRPDISALVPDYLDLPPPYQSPNRERPEHFDWKAYFESRPLPNSHGAFLPSAIENVVSPSMPTAGAWDRVASRQSR